MRDRFPLLLLLLLVALAGCDLAGEDFAPEVVVEAVLVAGDPLPNVRLSETASIGAVYTFDAYALSGAAVEVALLAPGGGEEEAFDYTENPDFPGNYFTSTSHDAVPGRTYRLTVRVPGRSDLLPAGEAIRAETVVPDTFRVVRAPPDSIRYNIFAPSPAIDVTPSASPGRQAVYVFTVTALDPTNFDLTPTIASIVEQTGSDPEDFVNTSSPLLNEGNYERLADGSLRLRVPWFAISYYGPNSFTANALDNALFDFQRSRNAQFNPTTLSPGEIQRVLSNVENGTGVFGSIARVGTEAFIAE